MKRAATIAGIVLCHVALPRESAAEVDTEHLFGFTIGSDVGERGEKEIESESTARLGKISGTYAAISQQFEAKHTPFDDVRMGVATSFAYHDVSGVPGLEDRNQFAFESLSAELRYRLLNPERAPVGLTIGMEPHWARLDDVSGAPVDNYGGEFTIAVDKALVPERIYAAFNLLYDAEATRSRQTGAWQHESMAGMSTAMAFNVAPDFFAGAEVHYLRAYQGLALDAFAGHAVFVGPNVYRKLSKSWWFSAAWNVQIAGMAAGTSGPLDLTNFERHKVKLRFGLNF